MLRLMIMRHGEAATAIGFQDQLRKLTDHGHAQARATAEEFVKHDWIPDIALVSTATRTRETFAEVLDVLGQDIPATFIDRFYLGSMRDVVSEVEDLSQKTILLVGHNPGWTEITMRLTGEPVSLSPAQACLVSIAETKWSDAIHLDCGWVLDRWIRTR